MLSKITFLPLDSNVKFTFLCEENEAPKKRELINIKGVGFGNAVKIEPQDPKEEMTICHKVEGDFIAPTYQRVAIRTYLDDEDVKRVVEKFREVLFK